MVWASLPPGKRGIGTAGHSRGSRTGAKEFARQDGFGEKQQVTLLLGRVRNRRSNGGIGTGAQTTAIGSAAGKRRLPTLRRRSANSVFQQIRQA